MGDAPGGQQTDVQAIAEEAGLRYVTDAAPGFRRRTRGDHFTYRDRDGRAVGRQHRARIDKLAIPPAWSDVWICPYSSGHLQATGRDAKGRKQYRYHDRWREVRDADKFSKLADFGASLGELRQHVDDDLANGDTQRDQVLAAVVTLLDDTLIRVGNEEYAATNDSFGLTTLRPEHVTVGRRAFNLCFVGKSGVEHDITIEDPKLARIVRRCHELQGQELFSYRASDGTVANITSGDVNDYLRRRVGPDVSAKVFRTWGASTVITRVLAGEEPAGTAADADAAIVAAIDLAADQLRNTRAVCRQSYAHPSVLDAYRDGTLSETWAHTRAGSRLSRSERTLLRTLRPE